METSREERRFWAGWLAAMALGKTVGVALALGVFGLVISYGFGAPRVEGVVAIIGTMFLAGALDGGAVGLAQALVLHRFLRRLPRGRWIAATALGAGTAWGVGIAGNVFLANHLPDVESPGLAAAFITIVLVVGGAALGSIVGAAQWLVLHARVEHAGWWIPANALAWIVGTAVAWVATSRLGAGIAAAPLAVAGASIGIATGLAIGAITGGALAAMMPRRRIHA